MNYNYFQNSTKWQITVKLNRNEKMLLSMFYLLLYVESGSA